MTGVQTCALPISLFVYPPSSSTSVAMEISHPKHRKPSSSSSASSSHHASSSSSSASPSSSPSVASLLPQTLLPVEIPKIQTKEEEKVTIGQSERKEEAIITTKTEEGNSMSFDELARLVEIKVPEIDWVKSMQIRLMEESATESNNKFY